MSEYAEQAAQEAGPHVEADDFLDTVELAARVKVCPGTISNWRKTGKIPFILTPGRLVRFHWISVRNALLRMQRGGVL
jgi:predicted site-specific integrase-resolvase